MPFYGRNAPSVIATFPDSKHFAHDHDGKFLLVLFDKLIFHLESREKMLTTSDRISLFRENSCIRNALLVGGSKCQRLLHQKSLRIESWSAFCTLLKERLHKLLQRLLYELIIGRDSRRDFFRISRSCCTLSSSRLRRRTSSSSWV